MNHATSLGFIDKIDCIPDPYFEDPTLLSTSMDDLRKLMSKAHEWSTIEQMDGAPELLPAKLLSEIPIAVHKAGVNLRDINIGCFPTRGNQTMVFPSHQDHYNAKWSDLRAACQSISKFSFGAGNMNKKPVRDEPLAAKDQQAMDQYLSTMISGNNLQDLMLNFHVFGINTRRAGELIEEPHHIGKLLESVVLPRITTLHLGGGAAMNQDELEHFCRGLGGTLTSVHLHSLDLSNGSWAGILDILRDKVGTRRLEGRCRVSALGLKGGEFGQRKRRDPFASFLKWAIEPEPSIVLRSFQYVTGAEEMANPLRQHESQGAGA
ncbi:hypothetical protein ONS96_005833 [Cadophora gregata f. sp. sojae]|nr:hypothetical protein ONS96_005833 [Cadophora gregata f. sp. sojae]